MPILFLSVVGRYEQVVGPSRLGGVPPGFGWVVFWVNSAFLLRVGGWVGGQCVRAYGSNVARGLRPIPTYLLARVGTILIVRPVRRCDPRTRMHGFSPGIRSVAAVPYHAAGLRDQPDVVLCCGPGGAVWGEGRDR